MKKVRDAEEAIAAFDADPFNFKAPISDICLGPGQSGWDVARPPVRTIPPCQLSTSAAIAPFIRALRACLTAQ